MGVVLDVLTWLSIAGGLFFMLVGTVGILRMPDVYTRLHAAGMTDTMGAGLLILGMCLHTAGGIMDGHGQYWFVLFRLVFIYAFLLFTSPIATHAVARAALHGGLEPYRVSEESAD